MSGIDLKGKKALVIGIGDDQGYGFGIAKQLFTAGADVMIGVWTPVFKIFTTSWENGKFDASRKLDDGRLFEYKKAYSIDALYDTPESIPDEIKSNKRYVHSQEFTVSEVAKKVESDFGKIDILVHSLANGPEVKKPLLETSREGYLAALNSSSYSFVSLVKHFGPIINKGGSVINLSYIASTRVIPGYGGGMSSAKAALESDTRTLAYEAGRRWGIRINAISAGPLRSRAAKAIGFIEDMINYSLANAPLQKDLLSEEVGQAATFLASSMASAITGDVLFVDNGLHAMGLALDSPSFAQCEKPIEHCHL